MSTVVLPADLDFSNPVFPVNAINVIYERFKMFTNLKPIRRSLRPEDPNLSVGISGTSWAPVAGSQEMRGVAFRNDATLEHYLITVEGFVRDTDEERGLAAHSVLSEAIRTTLADDDPLRTQLGGLQAVFGTTKKSLQRFSVRSASFASGKVQGAFMYVTTTEMTLEVEKTNGW